VPLSEHEQRILEEIEKNLYHEDPSFARGVRRRTPRLSPGGRARLGGLVFLFGFATLIAFFLRGWVIVGVVAFVLMVSGIVLMAGALATIAGGGRDHKARFARWLTSWEERVKERYKRR
jgi:Flp pilus assembly protein TadB